MNIGTQVLRKKGDLDDRVGTIERVFNGKAYVRWSGYNRIGGEFNHSTISLRSLIVADPEIVEQRRAAIREMNARRKAEHLARCTFVCNSPNHRRPLPLQPSQVQDGRCYYCGSEVAARD